MLEISTKVADTLPSSVKTSLGKLTSEQQSVFEEEYKRKMKKSGVALCLAILLPGFDFFYRNEPVKAILFWITVGGLGIWYIINIFTVSKKIRERNEEASKSILRDMKIMSS